MRVIDRVQEYRTRLIAELVTGKVDVRHLAPETWAAAAGSEALDEVEGEAGMAETAMPPEENANGSE
jgi:hypothetical protein